MRKQQNVRLGACVLVGVVALAGAGMNRSSVADEKIGKVQQPLVGGQEVSESEQERLGLLSLENGSGSCSASLLRNNWVITAAHCVETEDAAGDPIPDPDRLGQNTLVPVTKVKLTALWGKQTQTASRIETFRPYDVAIIELFDPIKVKGRSVGFVRRIFEGDPKGVEIRAYGRGINEFATGSGAGAVPSKMDSKFRVATFTVSVQRATTYRYATEAGDMIAGGDSGGPALNGKDELVGVHSTSNAEYVMGKPREWAWATKATAANDAPVAPVWRQLAKIMGPVPSRNTPEPAPPPDPVFQYTVPFGANTRADEFNTLYGVKQDGTLMWHRHIISSGSRRVHSWNAPRRVGDGWLAGYKGAYPGGLNVIYTLSDNGDLRWHWHTGVIDGRYQWREPSHLVGTSWTTFDKVIPMDKGVIYGILPDGTLRWHKHLKYQTGEGGNGANGWADAKIVHSGFDKYRTVFSGGNGVFYAVGNNGVLYWFRHRQYLDSPSIAIANLPKNLPSKLLATLAAQWLKSWEGPIRVGDDWDGFTKLFSPGEGHIYGVMPNGDLMYHRHLGWETGNYYWDEKVNGKISTGWDAYAYAFARNDTSDLGSRNPEVDIIVN